MQQQLLFVEVLSFFVFGCFFVVFFVFFQFWEGTDFFHSITRHRIIWLAHNVAGC